MDHEDDLRSRPTLRGTLLLTLLAPLLLSCGTEDSIYCFSFLGRQEQLELCKRGYEAMLASESALKYDEVRPGPFEIGQKMDDLEKGASLIDSRHGAMFWNIDTIRTTRNLIGVREGAEVNLTGVSKFVNINNQWRLVEAGVRRSD